MSALNWIEVQGHCQSCKEKTLIKCQTHFCSDYDGDETGRFHDRSYKLGEKMAWWPGADVRYSEWMESNADNKHGCDLNTECCYSECGSCKAELFVVIKFKECVPTEILETDLVSNWPKGYYK